MKKWRRIIDRFPPWIFTLLTVLLILWLTLAQQPLGDIEPPMFPGADKLVHAIMFGWLAAMIILDDLRSRGWRMPSIFFIIASVIGSSAFGVAIEFVQDAMHRGRSFDTTDMVADAVGALIAGVIWFLLRSDFDGGEQDSR